ncbi:MAG: hypothetical protein DDT21_01838 [Syntrophomonadaceae bacterium]|nr:hypothetical protein [Bacillota bacterium]
MADRQFTYKVDIDIASAKKAADAVRVLFAKSISGVGGQGGDTQIRKIANFEISEARRVANARIHEIKRIWAVEKAEAAQAMARGQRQVRGAALESSRLQGVLKTGFLSLGAFLAAEMAIRGTVEFGRIGAQQLRTQETIQHLGDQVGVDTEKMAAAVKKATNSSISDMQAMQFSANVLAQRFATNVDDISADTAVLAKASRRLAQIYMDESGQLMTTEQVFSRLIKFAREGNKELVDQFGISNQLIAETLNIPLAGLAGSGGAAHRWRGMIQIMNEELIRLGEPVDSVADRMEQAFGRITTEMDKLRQAAAEPITIFVEVIANQLTRVGAIVEGISATKEIEELYKKSQIETSPALDMVRDTVDVLNNALLRGTITLPEYTTNIRYVVDAYHDMEEAARQAAMEAAKLADILASAPANFMADLLAQGTASQRMQFVLAGDIAPSDLTEAEREYRMAVGDSAEKVRILQAAVDAAAIGTDEWIAAMFALTGAQLSLAGDIDAVKGKFLDLQTDIAQYQLDMRLGAAANDTERLAILRERGLSDTTPEGRKNELQIANLEQSIAQENARLGKAAQQEWMRTAKEVEQLFKSAADKIMGIPGVTSLTPVTEQEMLNAKYGVYQNQPDEWVRQVRDELINKVDWPDVSREQVAGLTGLSAELPSEVLINRLEQKWESGSLFADPANLGLMNMDAIRGQYEEMKAGATGRANQQQYIMEQLGVSQADAALITGQQAPIVQMLTGGQSEEEISSQLGSTLSSVMSLVSGEMNTKAFAQNIGGGLSSAFDPGSENYIDVAGPTLSAWNTQFGTEAIVKGLKSVGKSAALNFFGGFTDGVTESKWGTAIVTAIMNSLNAKLTAAAVAN